MDFEQLSNRKLHVIRFYLWIW